MIDFLQTGLLDELIMICEPEELNIIFEWILVTCMNAIKMREN